MAENTATKHKNIFFAAAGLIIIIGLVVAVIVLATSKTSSPKQTVASQTATDNAEATQTKTSPCKKGTNQAIGNSSYLVGADIAPGTYSIAAHKEDGVHSGTEINVYNSKAEYIRMGKPANYEDKGDQSVYASDSDTQGTIIKLSAGQYMVVDSDSATFTCE